MTTAVRFPARGAPASIAAPHAAASSTLAAPPRWLYEALAATASASGVTVTSETAMRCVAVFACVKVLAESMAQLPLAVYRRRADGGAEEDAKHPLYPLLHDAPNDWQTSFEWREMAMGHTALRGNAYAFISRRPDGHILELLPLHPDRVAVEQLPDWSLRYTVTQGSGGATQFGASEILHLRGLTTNGILGITPIAHAREAIGLSLAAEDHGARLFSNGATPGGILAHPGKLSVDAAANLKASWQAAHGGANRHGTAVLEEGMTWTQLGITNKDSQFLETRKYQRSDIASLFRVPLHLIGDLEHATFSNIEQQSLEFVIHTLMPWVKRWEQRLSRQLLTPADRQSHFIRFKIDGLLRGDIAARYAAYAVAVTNGWMNRNEVRALEGLNREDGLDAFLSPLNMTPAPRAGVPTPELAP